VNRAVECVKHRVNTVIGLAYLAPPVHLVVGVSQACLRRSHSDQVGAYFRALNLSTALPRHVQTLAVWLVPRRVPDLVK